MSGKLFKKLVIMFCILSMLFIFSCSRRRRDDEGTILRIWVTYNDQEHAVFEELIDRFIKHHYDKTGEEIEVIADRVPFADLTNSIKTACMAGINPDIARVSAGDIIEFAYHKVLEPLDQLPNFDAASIDEKRKQFVPAAFNSNVINIKGEINLYGLPDQTTCLALFRNRDMFRDKASELRAAGLDPNRAPENLDEFIEYGKILTDRDRNIFGFAMSGGLWFNLPWFNMFHVDLVTFDEDGRSHATINSPQAIYAFDKVVSFFRDHQIEAGAWQAGAIGPDQGFINERYAMIFMGPWMLSRFKNAGLNYEVSLIPRPSKQDAINAGLIPANASDELYNEKITSSSNIGGSNMGIFRNSRHKELAFDFLNFITSKESQLHWARSLNQFPVNLAAYDKLIADPEVEDEIRVFMQQLRLAKAPPMVPLYGLIEADIVNLELEEALKGNKTVEHALNTAAQRMERLVLDEMNEWLD